MLQELENGYVSGMSPSSLSSSTFSEISSTKENTANRDVTGVT